MRTHFYLFIFMNALFLNCLTAQEAMEEVVVTSSILGETLAEIENPLHVVDGEYLANSVTQSIGEAIDSLLGVASMDYGSAVGQPIIRGLSGNRVKILNNGMVVRDVSGIGADHIVDIDLNNIQQVEVVNGPSSLLYSNGTIGGIINIVDNTIARRDFSDSIFRLGIEAQSVNGGQSKELSYQGNLSGLNLSYAFKDSEFDNFDIPNGAIIHAEESYMDEKYEEGLDFLPNSDFETTSYKFGLSRTSNWGYFGISINDIASMYGIPYHGEGRDNHEEDAGEYGDERTFSVSESRALNLEGSYIFQQGLIKEINYFYRDSDYSLTEQHAEQGGAEPEEGPTLFKNDAREYGAIFDVGNESLSQKISLNMSNENISIIGEEAYMNPTESDEITLGYYLTKDLALLHIDLGIRYDQINRGGSTYHNETLEIYTIDLNNTSFAMSAGKNLGDSYNISLGFANVKRAPSVVELFMNGPHLATGRFERGNAALKSERSSNIDITLNYENNGFYGSFALFRNSVDDYIYLEDETDTEHDVHADEHPINEGFIHANYLQNDARLDGYELEIGKTFKLTRGALSVSLGRDTVSGQFTDGNNIPRMVPKRNLYELSYEEDNFMTSISLKDVAKQNDIAQNETSTDGYQMLGMRLSKTLESGLTISLFGDNLLNESARNHTSFVKNEVPLPGKNFGVKFNLKLS